MERGRLFLEKIKKISEIMKEFAKKLYLKNMICFVKLIQSTDFIIQKLYTVVKKTGSKLIWVEKRCFDRFC
jgi:hypothetical protein